MENRFFIEKGKLLKITVIEKRITNPEVVVHFPDNAKISGSLTVKHRTVSKLKDKQEKEVKSCINKVTIHIKELTKKF